MSNAHSAREQWLASNLRHCPMWFLPHSTDENLCHADECGFYGQHPNPKAGYGCQCRRDATGEMVYPVHGCWLLAATIQRDPYSDEWKARRDAVRGDYPFAQALCAVQEPGGE